MFGEYNRYRYEGPVKEFGEIISNHWVGETSAPSLQKARSNLTYQYKKQRNRITGTKITLPGKIVVVE